MAKRSNLRLFSTFAIPVVIGLASLIGLVAALLDDGAWDVIGWVGLAIPVAVLVWARATRPSPQE